MHPRYVSTSFVSFPFSLSSFSSERTIQGYIESRRTRAAPTHTHTRYRFTLGDPCETNAHKAEGRRRRGYIRDVSRRYCRCKLLCLACLLDGEHQLQLDSNACKEIHVVSTTTTNNNDNDDDDNLIKFQTIRIRRFKRKKKKKLHRNDPDSRDGAPRKRVYSRGSHGFPRYSHTQHTPKYPRALSSCIMHTEPAEATSPIYRGAWLLSAAGRREGRVVPPSTTAFSPTQVFRVILFFVRDSIAPPLPFFSPPPLLHLTLSPSFHFSSQDSCTETYDGARARVLPRVGGEGEEHANTPST